MRKSIKRTAAVLAALVSGIVALSPLVRAETFTSAAFLEWSRASQDSLIQASITMAGIVATQGRKDISRCIDNWYTEDDAIQRMRHDFILESARRYPSFHPQAVILAILQKQCGSFKSGN
jgi:hypothetical protein